MAESKKEPRDKLLEQIEAKESRKVKARKEGEKSAWFGLGMFGLVGWSVAIPTLIGIAVGIWLDSTMSDQFSWTLMGILVGIMLGCLNAWYWVKRESRHD
jgi:ATP synthase protein I